MSAKPHVGTAKPRARVWRVLALVVVFLATVMSSGARQVSSTDARLAWASARAVVSATSTERPSAHSGRRDTGASSDTLGWLGLPPSAGPVVANIQVVHELELLPVAFREAWRQPRRPSARSPPARA